MNEDIFLDEIKDQSSKAIIQLFINLRGLKTSLDLSSWAFHIFPEDFLQHFPDHLDYAPIELDDWTDASIKFDKVLSLMYNQFFVAHFGFVETFIDDIIKELYDVFYKEIKTDKISSTGNTILEILKKEKYEDTKSNMFSRLLLLKTFAGWSGSIFDDVKRNIEKYSTIRNTIAHSVGKIRSMQKVKHILSPEIIRENKIQLDAKTFQNYSEGMLKLCIRINNDIVKNNPELSSFMANQ